MMSSIIDNLVKSDEPSVRFKVLVNVLGKELESVEIIRLRQEIKSSPRVRSLLSERGNEMGKSYQMTL